MTASRGCEYAGEEMPARTAKSEPRRELEVEVEVDNRSFRVGLCVSVVAEHQ